MSTDLGDLKIGIGVDLSKLETDTSTLEEKLKGITSRERRVRIGLQKSGDWQGIKDEIAKIGEQVVEPKVKFSGKALTHSVDDGFKEVEKGHEVLVPATIRWNKTQLGQIRSQIQSDLKNMQPVVIPAVLEVARPGGGGTTGGRPAGGGGGARPSGGGGGVRPSGGRPSRPTTGVPTGAAQDVYEEEGPIVARPTYPKTTPRPTTPRHGALQVAPGGFAHPAPSVGAKKSKVQNVPPALQAPLGPDKRYWNRSFARHDPTLDLSDKEWTAAAKKAGIDTSLLTGLSPEFKFAMSDAARQVLYKEPEQTAPAPMPPELLKAFQEADFSKFNPQLAKALKLGMGGQHVEAQSILSSLTAGRGAKTVGKQQRATRRAARPYIHADRASALDMATSSIKGGIGGLVSKQRSEETLARKKALDASDKGFGLLSEADKKKFAVSRTDVPFSPGATLGFEGGTGIVNVGTELFEANQARRAKGLPPVDSLADLTGTRIPESEPTVKPAGGVGGPTKTYEAALDAIEARKRTKAIARDQAKAVVAATGSAATGIAKERVGLTIEDAMHTKLPGLAWGGMFASMDQLRGLGGIEGDTQARESRYMEKLRALREQPAAAPVSPYMEEPRVSPWVRRAQEHSLPLVDNTGRIKDSARSQGGLSKGGIFEGQIPGGPTATWDAVLGGIGQKTPSDTLETTILGHMRDWNVEHEGRPYEESRLSDKLIEAADLGYEQLRDQRIEALHVRQHMHNVATEGRPYDEVRMSSGLRGRGKYRPMAGGGLLGRYADAQKFRVGEKGHETWVSDTGQVEMLGMHGEQVWRRPPQGGVVIPHDQLHTVPSWVARMQDNAKDLTGFDKGGIVQDAAGNWHDPAGKFVKLTPHGGGGGPTPVTVENWPPILMGKGEAGGPQGNVAMGGTVNIGDIFKGRGRKSAIITGEQETIPAGQLDAYVAQANAATKAAQAAAKKPAREPAEERVRVTSGQRYEAKEPAREAQQERRRSLAEMSARISEQESMTPVRALPVLFEQITAQTLGGRGKIKHLAGMARFDIQQAQGEASKLAQLEGDYAVKQSSLRDAEAVGAKKQAADIRKQMTVLEPLIAGQKGKTAAAEEAAAKTSEFLTKPMMARSILAGAGGMLVGMQLFQVAEKGLDAGLSELSTIVGQTTERGQGFVNVMGKLTQATGAQILASGGNTQAAVAATMAQSGLGDSAAQVITPYVAQRSLMEAGNKALSDQYDLIRSGVYVMEQNQGMAANAGFTTGPFQPAGGIPGVTRSTGGLFGTPIGATPSEFEQLGSVLGGPSQAAQVAPFAGMAAGAAMGFVGTGFNPLGALAGGAIGLGAGLLAGGSASGPFPAKGFIQAYQNAPLNAQGVSALDVSQAGPIAQDWKRQLDTGTLALKSWNDNLGKTGSTFKLQFNSTSDQLIKSRKAMEAAGVDEPTIQKLDDMGVAMVDTTNATRDLTAADVALMGQQEAQGNAMPSYQQIIQQMVSRTIPAEQYQMAATAQLQAQQVIPANFALGQLANPILPYGATFPTTGGTDAMQSLLQGIVPGAQDTYQALIDAGKTDIAGLVAQIPAMPTGEVQTPAAAPAIPTLPTVTPTTPPPNSVTGGAAYGGSPYTGKTGDLPRGPMVGGAPYGTLYTQQGDQGAGASLTQDQINAYTGARWAGAGASQAGLLAKQNAQDAATSQTQLNAQMDITKVAELGIQKEALQESLAREQVVYQTAQYNNELRIANRSMVDAEQLTGKIGKGASDNLGYYERQNILLGRQSQELSFQLSQRQINLQLAIAGFMAPGETPEERAARMQEAQLEAQYAQKQLDIQKQMFGNEVNIVDIGNLRQAVDLGQQLYLLTTGRQITIDTAKVEAAMKYLDAAQQPYLNKAQTWLTEGAQAATTIINDSAAIFNQTGAAFGQIFVDIKTAWGMMNVGASDFLKNFGPVAGSTDVGSGRQNRAAGIVGMTAGATQMIVGEAGAEHVAVLRNPRAVSMADGGGTGGGNYTVVFQFNNPQVRSDSDIQSLTDAAMKAFDQKAALLGLRRIVQ
jgi:hypothetical protein